MIRSWKSRARELKCDSLTLYCACRDERTPWYAKLTAMVVVSYAFSPIDLIPDFIPVLGLVDDLVLIPLGVMLVRRMIPFEVLEYSRRRAEAMIDRGKPGGRSAAVVIVVIWAIAAGLGCYWFMQWLAHR